MDHSARSVSLRAQFIFAFVLTAVSAWAANRHDLLFTYSVAQEPGSGPLVRIALHIQLTNRGKDPVSIRSLMLPHLRSLDQPKPVSPVTVQPHSSQEITQELTLSRLEFEQWQKGTGPKIVLQVQSAGNQFMEMVQPDKLPLEKE